MTAMHLCSGCDQGFDIVCEWYESVIHIHAHAPRSQVFCSTRCPACNRVFSSVTSRNPYWRLLKEDEKRHKLRRAFMRDVKKNPRGAYASSPSPLPTP